MNIDQFKDMTVREFVSAVLPGLPRKTLDEFCDPGQLDKSNLVSQMPFETKIFMYRKDKGVHIDLTHNGQVASIRAAFESNPFMHDDIHTLPRVSLSAVYLGENRIGQTMFDHAFYPPWRKAPGMLETFRTKAQGGHVTASHKLDEQRLQATCSAMNHTAMHLAGGVIPALEKIAPVFSPDPLGNLPILNNAARLHRIAAGARRQKHAPHA